MSWLEVNCILIHKQNLAILMTLVYDKAFEQHVTLLKRNQVYQNDELGHHVTL
jgi:hypothetical protein